MKSAITIIFLSLALGAFAQTTEKINIPLSNPGKQGMLELSLVNGDITIEGYDGAEVMVEATIGAANKNKNKSKNQPPPGMTRIEANPVEITAREDRNEVEIETESWKRRTDLKIKVPKNFHLNIGTIHGDIEVYNIQGAIEVSNVNGPIKLDGIDGSVLSNTVNGGISARFTRVEPADARMSFASLNGDVDVTLPANIKATARMKSDRGEIYTDFEMETETIREELQNDESCDCEYEVTINSTVSGKINGGGPTYTFKNMNGDIIIRKGN